MKRDILTKNKTKCGGKSKKNGLLRIKNTGSLHLFSFKTPILYEKNNYTFFG